MLERKRVSRPDKLRTVFDKNSKKSELRRFALSSSVENYMSSDVKNLIHSILSKFSKLELRLNAYTSLTMAHLKGEFNDALKS